METGSVLSWGRKEGEAVSEGDLLAEIETDKATMSMDASDTGIMAKILVPAGTKDVPIGTPLCVIVESEGDVAAFKDFSVSATAQTKTAAKPEAPPAAPRPAATSQPPVPPVPIAVPAAVSTGSADQRLFVSPYARTLAAERNIDLASAGIVGSGPDGRIRARDLDQVGTGARGQICSSAASYTDVELSNMRKVIAQRLCLSKQTIPHYYLTMEVRMDRVIEMRHKINKRLQSDDKKGSSKISVNDFVIKAAAVACMRVVQCNSSWQDSFIRQYNQVDVSVAVATPSGLITPIVFNAQSKGLKEINSDVALLAVKARENKLQPKEFQGGTFTVSNLGMYGITNFSAIINPPQACILAVGGSQERLVHNDKSDTGFSRATYMSVTLCCDHRVVDGAVGAQWLMEFRDNMEDPANMLL